MNRYSSFNLVDKRNPNLPILAGTSFLLISVLLYWGQFKEQRNFLVILYIFMCVYVLLLGSHMGTRLQVKGGTGPTIKQRWLVIASLMLAITSTANISTFYTSLSDIQQFILQPGAAYEHVKLLARTGQINESNLGGFFGPLITIFAFTKYVVFSWTILFWSKLSKIVKVISLSSMFYYLVQVLLIGAMVNIATVSISMLVVAMATSRRGIVKHRRRILWLGALLASVAIVLLSFFRGAREADAFGFVDRVMTGAEGLIYYVSHGYVGLGYAFQQPFVFTNGQTALYGFSRLYTDGLSPDSYLARSELTTGWDATQVWSTAVPWLASDISFIGVPLVLLLVGIWAGRLWRTSCETLDPFALLVLGQLTIGIFFFPANNHLMQTFANASGFLAIVLLYLSSRLFKGYFRIESGTG